MWMGHSLVSQFGNRAGSFGSLQTGLDDELYVIDAADVNGDNIIDVSIGSLDFSSDSVVMLGSELGTFAAIRSDIVGYRPRFGDFNGDEAVDLVTWDQRGYLIYYGNGSGQFRESELIEAEFPSIFFDVLDINQDGRDDILASAAFPYLGQSDGSFIAGERIPVPAGVNDAEYVDWNGDGIFDWVWLSTSFGAEGVFIALGGADGEYSAPIQISARRGRDFVVSDFNTDGQMDVAVIREELSIYLSTAGGQHVESPSYGISRDSRGLKLGDLNGDGISDLITSNAVVILNQDGSINTDDSFAFAGTIQEPLVFDADGDGMSDIVGTGGSTVHTFLSGSTLVSLVQSYSYDRKFSGIRIRNR